MVLEGLVNISIIKRIPSTSLKAMIFDEDEIKDFDTRNILRLILLSNADRLQESAEPALTNAIQLCLDYGSAAFEIEIRPTTRGFRAIS
jgi:hypothetical protein